MYESISRIKNYCSSLTEFRRFKTREVHIGDIPCGGNNPVRIQSMTITDTMDTAATVEQSIRMVNSGCDYVRITAPSRLEAQNLENIRRELRNRGYKVPLIADIHFTPNAAEIAARIVEKVRINPGNYADRKKFESIEYTDKEYEAELERIRTRFLPLVKVCREYGTAMRIGTNHGSLSDRIMSRYGDTPLGMVESALEFVRICEELDYREIVLSMKASNPQVMIQAYRLLVSKMIEEGMNYPLHLGVTEAGGGEDGRIKSALGIGALLEDGLGDTIRVSLTEDPEYEAPVAILLADRYKERFPHKRIPKIEELPYNPFSYKKRNSFDILGIGGDNPARVISDYGNREIEKPSDLSDIGYLYDASADKWNMTDFAADFLYAGKKDIPFEIPNGLKVIFDFDYWLSLSDKSRGYPFLNLTEYLSDNFNRKNINFLKIRIDDFNPAVSNLIKESENTILVIETDNKHGMAEQRRFFAELILNKIKNPAVIKKDYEKISVDEFRLYSATDLGALLIDGLGDAVWCSVLFDAEHMENHKNEKFYVRSFLKNKELKEKSINRILFGILQAARVRISKTEYIACPSCGRTLFDLQETTERIRKQTEHLKGVKIAIMGCIVNGPGEMADADYGYVGSGIGKISLYKEKELIKRNVPAEKAVEELINLIKTDGKWQEPKII